MIETAKKHRLKAGAIWRSRKSGASKTNYLRHEGMTCIGFLPKRANGKTFRPSGGELSEAAGRQP
jgi:hypothetical protein